MTVLPPKTAGFAYPSAHLAIKAIVRRNTAEADGINSPELLLKDCGKLPAFSAGAYSHVYLANGVMRKYSLCHPPSDRASYVVAFNHEAKPHGGSAHIHENWRIGSFVQINPPENPFPLVQGVPALLFAAGIGVTPMLTMAEELSRSKYASSAKLCFSGSPGSRRMNVRQILVRSSCDKHEHVCEPEKFVEVVLDEAAVLGWQSAKLHREFLSSRSAWARQFSKPWLAQASSCRLRAKQGRHPRH